MGILEIPGEYHAIALTIVAIISLFSAYIFWLGYRRVGTRVMLYPAVAFALYSLRTFSLVFIDFKEIHVYLELVILSLLALALLKKPKGEVETDNMLEETLRQKEDAVGKEEEPGGKEGKEDASGIEDSDSRETPGNPG